MSICGKKMALNIISSLGHIQQEGITSIQVLLSSWKDRRLSANSTPARVRAAFKPHSAPRRKRNAWSRAARARRPTHALLQQPSRKSVKTTSTL